MDAAEALANIIAARQLHRDADAAYWEAARADYETDAEAHRLVNRADKKRYTALYELFSLIDRAEWAVEEGAG